MNIAFSRKKPHPSSAQAAYKNRPILWFFLNNGIIIALIVEILFFSFVAKENLSPMMC